MGFDVFALDAANNAQSAKNNAKIAAQAANSNLTASVTLLQMGIDITDALREMREWERQRFNCVVDYVKDNNQKITALQEQVAALQKRLYEQEKRIKAVDKNYPRPEEMEPPCPEEIEP